MTDHPEAPEVPVTEEPTAPATASEHAAGLDVFDEPQPDADPDARLAKANAEAARYRRERNSIRDERDTLVARVQGYERSAVEEIARAAGMGAPDDIWLVGTELEALRGEDGILDRDAVERHVAELKEQRPHWFPRPRAGSAWPATPPGPRGVRPGEVPSGLERALKP